MKLIVCLIFIFTLSLHLVAQVRIGVKGSWNYSTARAMYTNVKQSTGYVSGYGAGMLAKIPFDGALHFSPAVMINNRGFSINNPAGSTNKKEKYSITYVDICPSFSFDYEDGNNTVSLSFGPDFGFTNFGKIKTTDATNNTTSKKMSFGFGAYGWFDLGLNTSVAYRMKKTFVELGYYTGLSSINNNEEVDGRNIRNRMLSLSIGYFFKQTAAQ
jgi:hypothetical protein